MRGPAWAPCARPAWPRGVPLRCASALAAWADTGAAFAAAAMAAEAALASSGRGRERPALAWGCAAPGREGEVIAGLASVLGSEMPILGGSSADNDVAGQWWQRGAGLALGEGVVVAVLSPSGRVGHAFQSGHEPAGHRGRASRVEGREIIEIEGRPAAAIHGAWTGGRLAVPPGDVRALLGESTRGAAGARQARGRGPALPAGGPPRPDDGARRADHLRRRARGARAAADGRHRGGRPWPGPCRACPSWAASPSASRDAR